MLKAFSLGLLASLFFAVTFILNRQMDVAGGHWIWTSSLRFFFMLLLLFVLLLPGKRYRKVLSEIYSDPGAWALWSAVGFGVFYSFICLASAYGPSWLIAATWQVTIVAGALLSPLFYIGGSVAAGPAVGAVPRRRHGLPARQIVISMIILAGVVLILARDASVGAPRDALAGSAFVLVAAFAYPLGNRKMMELTDGRLDALERVFGMTLCSMPVWMVLSAVGLALGIKPSRAQLAQTFVVALFAGVVATFLFFKATGMARGDARQLAIIESTQAGEVVFALLGGVLIYKDAPPDLQGYVGLVIVVSGLVMNGMPAGSAASVRARREHGE